MKNILILSFYVFFLTGCNVFNFNPPVYTIHSDAEGDKEKWEYYKDNFLYGSDVGQYSESIKLELSGDYKPKDSVFVTDVISELNMMMESQKIYLVATDGNFVLDFKNDPLCQNEYNYEKVVRYSWPWKNFQRRRVCINEEMIDSLINQRIEGVLIRGLVFPNRGYLDKQEIAKGSIFSSTPIYNTYFSDLDRFILSTVYANDYENHIDRFFPHIGWEQNEERGYPFYFALAAALLLLWYFDRRNYFFADPIKTNQYFKNGLLILSAYIVFYAIKSFGGYYVRSYLAWYFYFLGFILIKGMIVIPLLWWIEQKLFRSLSVKMKVIGLFCAWWIILGVVYTPDLTVDPDRMIGNNLQNAIITFSLALLRVILWIFNYKTRQTIRQKDLELSNLEKLKQQAELQALHSRINPHFLYNSLNSIASLAHEDANKTEQMALSLSDFCRSAINKQNKDSATIAEEVALIRNYLEIEKVRFGDRLNYKMDIEASLETQEIPRFLLQPLVENAIKHGVAQITTQGFIRIEVVFDNDRIVLKVYDNGPDFPDELITGYGLQSLHDKLQIIYKDAAHLNWQNSPEKCICVTLPFKSQFASYE